MYDDLSDDSEYTSSADSDLDENERLRNQHTQTRNVEGGIQENVSQKSPKSVDSSVDDDWCEVGDRNSSTESRNISSHKDYTSVPNSFKNNQNTNDSSINESKNATSAV